MARLEASSAAPMVSCVRSRGYRGYRGYIGALGLTLTLVCNAAVAAELPREVKQALASRNYDSAVTWLEENVDDPEAAFELGRLYRLGKGVPADQQKALNLFQASAEAGHVDAQYLLGKHHEKVGDMDTAASWMAQAEAGGHRRASTWNAPTQALQTNMDLSAMIRARRQPPASAPRELINQAEASGRTPLMLAASAGETDWLEFLLAAEALINASDRHGVTALQCAVMAEQGESVRVLLQAGADPKVPNREGNTALHLAVANGSVEIADLLLAAPGADDVRNSAGWSAADLAARSSDASMMGLFDIQPVQLERAVVIGDAETLTQLVVDAAMRGNTKLLDELLARPDFDAEAVELERLLAELCNTASVPALQKLVAAGVPVEGRNERGLTALLVAAETGCLECVEVLVQAGAALEATDEQGRNSLLRAARAGHDAVAMGLLKAGAEMNSMDDLGRNALWWAVREKHWPLAEMLLGAGSAVTADAGGLNPLHLAAEANEDSILSPLVARLPVDQPTLDGNTALLIAAHAGATDAARELLLLDAEVNYRNPQGDTALIFAARQSHLSVARLLLDAGADPGVRNDRFESARSIVAARGETAWVELLESSKKRGVFDLLGAR